MDLIKVVRFFAITILIGFISAYSAMAAPIPPEIKTVVAFIFIANDDGKPVPNGTGFFVGVKNPSNPDFINVNLVTAKHVESIPFLVEIR